MNGAERAGALPEGSFDDNQGGADWLGVPAEAPRATEPLAPADESETGGSRTALAVVLWLLAAAWIGAVGYALWRTRPSLDASTAVSWIATLSGPLILLSLLWLLFGRTRRSEAERFTRAVRTMRAESVALESVLEIVSGRIEENHAKLRDKAERLMSLGDEASDRLGRVTHYLAKESDTLGRQAAALDAAASAAKVDVGVLLHDLPKAEEQARAVASAMQEAGLTAHGQAGALEAQLSAIAARAREADEVLGNAAERMAARVARIESSSAAAANTMGEASAGMVAAVDGAMVRAADAVDASRAALDAQAGAVMAAIEQNRAALEQAGEEATQNFALRLDTVSGRLTTLAADLAAQDAASHALVTGLARELETLDETLAQLGATGVVTSDRIAGTVQGVRDNAGALFQELGQGAERASLLMERAEDMARALAVIAAQVSDELPSGLLQVEQQAVRTRDAASSLAPLVEGVRASADIAAIRMGEAEAAVTRQRETLDQLLSRIDEGSAGAEQRLLALGEAASAAQAAAARIVSDTGPELVEALVRVREASNQAAERAREAIASVIPASAAALGDAGREALVQAVGDTVERQMAELNTVSERAMATAQAATERLTRQMLTLGETAAAIEARIDDVRREQNEKESESFSRRVALLIESLNSTAIDVTKILSNDVTDSAWAAYLKGDRGVFTRRAVRLLDATETREIARHYDEEHEFRDQVNRYIHDFEAMLRRVLADRDGSSLGITLLSSDMGKLYVALAQAIERLRK
jgi:hypothetical protein